MTEQLQWWNARVDWNTPDPLDQGPDALDLILDHLEGHSAVISRHPIDGIWEARISLQAPVDVAVTMALDLVVAGRPRRRRSGLRCCARTPSTPVCPICRRW